MKQNLRNIIKMRRQNFSASDFIRESHDVISQVENLPQFINAAIIATFWSLPDEVDTHEFIENWCDKKTILLPVMQSDGTLKLAEYKKGCKMNCASYDILEPDGDECHISDVEFIMVPGMAFDLSGNRLGRGKGFYDRLLHDSRAFKAGVCFSYQIVDSVPTQSHDIAVDVVITPR